MASLSRAMYKRASRNLLHAHRVNAPLPTGGYIGAASDDGDILASPGNMSLPEVQAERVQLRTEQIRLQADLAAAKARGDGQTAKMLGQALAVNARRANAMRGREHELIRQSRAEALADAIKEIVPDMAMAIFKRADELCGTSQSVSRISEIARLNKEQVA